MHDRSRAEERLEFRGDLVWLLLRQIVPAIERASFDLVGPVAPDRKHVVPLLELASPGPEREHLACYLARAVIRRVVHAIDRRAGPVVLADRMPGRLIAERGEIVFERFLGEEIPRLGLARGVPEPVLDRKRVV